MATQNFEGNANLYDDLLYVCSMCTVIMIVLKLFV